MTLEDSIHRVRLRVMARAQGLGNVAQACREAGISRTLFCRWRQRYLALGCRPTHLGGHGHPPLRSPAAIQTADSAD